MFGTTVVRRRALNDVALYEIGDMKLLFWNTCSNQRALGQWLFGLVRSRNSSCVARRAAACLNFIATPNTNIGSTNNQWLPFPNSFTQLVVTNITGCAAISITSMYNVYYNNYGSVYNYFSNVTKIPDLTHGNLKVFIK